MVLAIAASSFAGGGSAGSSGGAAGPTPISIFMSTHGRTYREDLPNVQEIMRKTNIRLDVIATDEANAINLLFASNDLPDIIEFSTMGFQQYLSTGYIRAIDDLLKSNGQNIQKNIPQDSWKLMTVQGKTYAVPFENNRIKLYTYARLDWINNLGIDLSQNKNYGNFGGKMMTLNEYRDLLTKFTRNDPDKNGRNDTYGLGGASQKNIGGWSNICGAFGGIPGHYYIRDDKAIPWVVTDQFRESLQYINQLWRDGIVDPEIYLVTNDQAKQKMINSSAGSGTGEWWSNAHVIQIEGLQALQPQADFISILLTSNDGRISGAPDNGMCTNTWTISTQSKNPEKAMALIDFLNTDEGWYLAWYGVQGQDYTLNNVFPSRTESGTNLYNAMTLDCLYPLACRLDLMNNVAKRPTTEWTTLLRQKWEVLQMDNTQPSYTSSFYGLPNPREFNEFGVDVNNWVEQSSMAFITGETPLNDVNWNNYINTWKRMGGVKILQGFLTAYNSLNGTRHAVGITE